MFVEMKSRLKSLANFLYVKIYLHPSPVRYLLGKLVGRLHLFSYETRVRLNAEVRPHYAYCILHAARLAKSLGHDRMSVIEFGVAGGVGLVNAEYHAQMCEKATGISIEVYGFDSGEGLPPPKDYRDLPYVFREGFYHMDRAVLEKKLTRAKIIFGDVKDTTVELAEEYNIAPIGCIFHDLDYYSSTLSSFNIFSVAPQYLLPRIYNYFDDIFGDNASLFCDFTGERLAISQYNNRYDNRKLSPLYSLQTGPKFPWHMQIFIHHMFDHPKYNQLISKSDLQLPLES